MTDVSARRTLPHESRLRHAADFAALRHAQGRVKGRCFMLRYGDNLAGTARLGIAVSRRVSPLAVERNRLKRHVRESFRQHRSCLHPVDVLVIAYRCARDQSSADLRRDLDRLWSRVKPLGNPFPRNAMKT